MLWVSETSPPTTPPPPFSSSPQAFDLQLHACAHLPSQVRQFGNKFKNKTTTELLGFQVFPLNHKDN
ncbi:hypothetical protein MHYP_G00120620 [Metynnis hypsauchen]